MAGQEVKLSPQSVERAHKVARWIVLSERSNRQFNERCAEIADGVAAYMRRYEDEVNAEIARLRAVEEEQ